MLKHKKYIQRQLYKSSRFLHKIYTLCVQEPFNGYENIYDGYETESFTYSLVNVVNSIGLYEPPIIVSVQGYLMLISRVHLMLLILKQRLLPEYCPTVKQEGLVVIKRKVFRNHTHFCAFAALFITGHNMLMLSRQAIYLLYAYFLALKATSSVMIFPRSLRFFIRPITFFYFFRWVVACYHPLISTCIKHFLHIFCNVSVKIFRFYLISKAVSIHITQLSSAAVLLSDLVVMKLMH